MIFLLIFCSFCTVKAFLCKSGGDNSEENKGNLFIVSCESDGMFNKVFLTLSTFSKLIS